jgi:threonine/homoserine/homoserine lactone efflux protein
VDLSLIGRGVLIGVGIAAPVGPIGALCIARALRYGWRAGFVAGLGAATADACYGAIAAFGLTVVMSHLLDSLGVLRLLGGLYLCYLGLRTMRAAPATAADTVAGSPTRMFAATFALTITNPLTIMSFAAIFAGVGVATNNSRDGIALVLGVFAGSALWWLALSSGVAAVRHRLTHRALRVINVLSGAIILGFGLMSLDSLVWGGT